MSVGGEKMDGQNIIDILEENNTKCPICYIGDWTVEILIKNFLPGIINNEVQPDQGLTLISAQCKKCTYVLLFNER